MSIKESNPDNFPTHEGNNPSLSNEFGSHFLVELIDCSPDKLKKAQDVKQIMNQVVQKSKSSMVGSTFHQFQPEGVSGIILIEESHFAIHTWPEVSYAAADIFTCGHEMDPYVAIEVMKEMFEAKEVRYQVVKRGF